MDAALPLRVRDEVVVADLTRGLPVEDFSIVVRLLGAVSAERFTGASLEVVHGGFFDTLVVRVPSHAHEVVAKAASERRPPSGLLRAWSYVTPVVSNCHHCESGMLRYLRSPSQKDYAADRGMISLGSCPPPEAFAS